MSNNPSVSPSSQDSPAQRRGLVAQVWGNTAVRYVAVGGFCFVIDVGLLWLLHDVLGLALAVATPIAFLASFAVTYAMQRIVAFGSDARVSPSIGRYTVLVIFNTISTTVIVWGLSAIGVPWIAGKVAAVVATTIWNYFIYRYWVFPAAKAASS